jgi:hypothetical protein
MRQKRLRKLLILWMALVPMSVLAQGNGRGQNKGLERNRTEYRDNDRHDARDRDRRSRSEGIITDRTYRNRAVSRPPGWDRGRKQGWGNCDVPPGQAKKSGCRDTIFGRRLDRRVIVAPRDRERRRNR